MSPMTEARVSPPGASTPSPGVTRMRTTFGVSGADAGAPAAIMNAINDALKPFKARVTDQPFTPQRILCALGKTAP
mgnify:CR=1 FL=1